MHGGNQYLVQELVDLGVQTDSAPRGQSLLLDQRADLSFTYYDRRSSDVILQVPVQSAATGALTQLKNAATITNKEVEIQLNARVINEPTYGWTIGFQYGRNRGKVVSLAEGVGSPVS